MKVDPARNPSLSGIDFILETRIQLFMDGTVELRRPYPGDLLALLVGSKVFDLPIGAGMRMDAIGMGGVVGATAKMQEWSEGRTRGG